MDGKRLICKISVKGFLSFGGQLNLSLEPLNVIIGTNGSGKSNLIEVFRLLKASADDINKPLMNTGEVDRWFWLGSKAESHNATLSTICYIEEKFYVGDKLDDIEDESYCLSHLIELSKSSYKFVLDVEAITFIDVDKPVGSNSSVVFARNENDDQILTAEKLPDSKSYVEIKNIRSHEVSHGQSVLAQRNDPTVYRELWRLREAYRSISLFAEANFGRTTRQRLGQNAALDSSFLTEDSGNLALVLNDLQNQPQVMRTIINRLKEFYPRVENIITRVQGGTVQIYFQEEGLTQTVPATRLSDGTLRYLCLLVILCHPTPPPLICIEEPELGMHPDIIPTIAELLIEASERTQLIVTTHSPMLVSAIGQTHPDAVVVCERDENGTQMRRLGKEQLAPWLADYSLGDIWMKGLIGGTRW